MRRVSVQVSLVIAFVFLLAVVGTTVASPQPRNVCGACGESFERVAVDQGVAVNVTESTATIHVYENGTATWIVTNRVNQSAVDQFAKSPESLERVSRAAVTSGWGLPDVDDGESVELRSTSVDDRNVTIRFRQTGASEANLGLTVVDTLHSEGVRGGWILNADRVTVVGPPGTEVVNDPAGAIDREYTTAKAIPEVDGRRATWRGSTTDRYEATFHDDLYVVYGPSETGGLRVDGAVALATAPIWVDNVQSYVVPAVVVYGLLLVGVAAAARRTGPGRIDRLGASVAGLGLVGVVAAITAQAIHEPSQFGGIAAVYLVTGAVARRRPARLQSVRRALSVAAVSVFTAGIVLLATTFLGRPTHWTVVSSLKQAVYHLPVAVAPAFGLAVARARDRRRAWELVGAFGGAALAFLLAGMALVPVATRPFGLVILFTVGGAITAGVLSVPLAALTARIWSNHHAGEAADRRSPADD